MASDTSNSSGAEGQGGAGTAGASGRGGERWRKAGKRVGFGMLGLGGILLVVFLLLPVWISNEQGRTYVLERINSRMQAKVAVEDWSLGWFRGTELKNMTITLPDGTRMLSCPRVQSELTLWGILWGRYDVGITKVDTVQVSLTKYADGTNSLEMLFPKGKGAAGLVKMFKTLRGSLQVGSAVVTLNSIATGQTLTYTDVKAAVTIASPYAPFHVQVSAVGGGGGGAGERSLSWNATLPALPEVASWPQRAWEAFSDMDLAATNVPTGLACDWMGMDPRWEASIGAVMERVRFSNHDTPPLETSPLTLEMKGTEGAFVDVILMLRTGSGNAGGAALTLSPSGEKEGHVSAALRVSPPLVRVLGHVNPVLGTIRSGEGLVHLTVTDLNWTPGSMKNLQAMGRMTFPPLMVERRVVTGELLKLAGQGGGEGAAVLPATAETLRLRAAGGMLGYENFTIICGKRQRMSFSGTVGFDGQLNLMAHVPAVAGSGETGTLGTSTADVPVRGTVERPVVVLPR